MFNELQSGESKTLWRWNGYSTCDEFIIMICIKFILVHRTASLLPESLDSPDCDYKWLQIYSNYNIEEYVHFFLKNVPVMQESNGIYLI